MTGKINLVILDDEERVSEGFRKIFLQVCPKHVSVNSCKEASKIYLNGDPDILIADARLGDTDRSFTGLLECRNLQENSGRMSRSIVVTKEDIPPYHKDAQIALNVIYKTQGRRDDSGLATLLEKACSSVEVKNDLKGILAKLEIEEAGVKKRYDEYECLYPVTFALRNAISEVMVLHNTRYFWFGQTLRRCINKIHHCPFWIDTRDEWCFWRKFDPQKRNHDEIIHESIESIINFYGKYLFSADGSDKHPEGIKKLVGYFRACEPILFAQTIKQGETNNYRDHFFHPFHNFILGALLIDWIISNDILKNEVCDALFKSRLIKGAQKAKGAPIWLQWFLASIFHDVGYFLSKSEHWIANFFSMFLGREYKKDSHLFEVFGQADYQSDLSHLADVVESGLVSKKYSCCTARGNRTRSCTRSYFENQLNSALRYDLDHGVLSALVFLTSYYAPPAARQNDTASKRKAAEEAHRDRVLRIKRAAVSSNDNYGLNDAERKMAEVHRDIILPACLAMAVHHQGFQKYGPVQLESDPLTFLLKYVDVCQEYGRPSALSVQSDKGSVANSGNVDLLGLQFIDRDEQNQIPSCRVILGSRCNQRFDNIASEATIIFGRHLVSQRADFSLILVNLSSKNSAGLLDKYFVKRDASLVPNERCYAKKNQIDGIRWFSTWVN